jgi:hypothetical protein
MFADVAEQPDIADDEAGQLPGESYDDFLDRRHKLATEHPLNKAAQRKADRAVAARRKAMKRKAEKLRERAEAMLNEASDLDWKADRPEYYEGNDELKELREKIEDEGYWAARRAINLG